MKCTSCGCTELIEVKDRWMLPFGVCGDATLEVKSGEMYICLECGHVEFFNKSYVYDYKSKIKKKEQAKVDIEKHTQRINELKNMEFDPTIYRNEISKLEEEIKTLKSLGVRGLDIAKREKAIKENQIIINLKADPVKEKEIKNLENEILKLKQIVKG